MDVDFWAARFHSSKDFPSMQSARVSGNYIAMEDEGHGEEVRAWFPCPFCYVEIEVSLLCVHLQEEHCFDLKNAVCPICAANLGRDPMAHFTVQHAHSIKRRRKSQKSGFWSNTSANVPKNFRELSSYFGTNYPTGVCGGNDPAPDPLLSPFLCTAPLAVPEDGQDNKSEFAAAKSDAESSKPAPSDELEEQDYEERRQRAAFIQELLLSTIF